MPQQRSLRVGFTAIALAVCLRAVGAGVPQKVWSWLRRPQAAALLISAETGWDVRFSSAFGSFFPDFVESPPVFLPEAAAEKPSFSDIEAVSLFYATAKKPDTAALLRSPLQWELRGPEPTVLILHTHTTESYTRQGEPYTEHAAWRTLDEDYNMLSIGAAVKDALAEAGIGAVQDRTLHDYPSYNGSYADARKSLAAYLEACPGIRLVLDLHRDAAGTGGRQLRTLAQSAGQDSAQLMLVLGANHEGYEENLSLALKLHAQLERQCPGITRPLQLRGARYNQDLCPGAVLVEVGAAGNSHDEALRAAEELARAIVALADGAAEG